jgi:hypothetical protein
MDSLREIIISLFAVDSIWSVVLRGGVWLVIALVIIISTDTANVQESSVKLKKNLGFLLMFLVLSGGLIYLLFGYTTANAAG